MLSKMKVFLSLFPSVALLCCVNINSLSCTAATDTCQRRISAVPGNQSVVSNIPLNNNFSVNSLSRKSVYFGVAKLAKNNVGVTVYTDSRETVTLTVLGSNGTYNICINVEECPLGFTNVKSKCVCSEFEFGGLLGMFCDNITFTTYVFSAYCVYNTNRSRSGLIAIPCPFGLSSMSSYFSLDKSKDYCSNFNRQGKLCGKCLLNYSISVYSDTFQCISNSHYKPTDIVKYIAVEIIPVTVFLLFILYFHITITSGPANGYIFFAQTVTMPFEVAFHQFLISVLFGPPQYDYLRKGLVQSVVIPYSIWNLDFHRLFGIKHLLLSKHLRAVDILALKYASAVYPLLLLIVCYTIIELQGMNVRPVIWMLKIICFPCMRWRRIWKAKISILDTFAAYILLSYYKILYVTFLLFIPTKVYGLHYGHKETVLGYDPTIKIFSGKHLPFLFAGIVVFLIFGIFPPLLLTVYQFKSCYSVLERLRLNRPGLEQFVQAFQGCYKDGSNGTSDRRFFAGLYFIFRLILALSMTACTNYTSIFAAVGFSCFGFSFLCAIFQPYKKTKYTVLDSLFFSMLGSIAVLQAYNYVKLLEKSQQSHDVLVNQFLLYLPLVYMTVYVGQWVFVFLKNRDPSRYLLLNDGELKEDNPSEEREEHRQPVNIDISPRPTITQTEVSIAELSQENTSSESGDNSGETAPLIVGRRREMKIFSQHAATLSAEYCIARAT